MFFVRLMPGPRRFIGAGKPAGGRGAGRFLSAPGLRRAQKNPATICRGAARAGARERAIRRQWRVSTCTSGSLETGGTGLRSRPRR
ncbi:hypothetical protein, partial [Achromobacter sp. DMS1]|uniref:hypothetical protein n=1 Tax=Achromobacter sp. DMS1 TaxID=1688405 RepID=UPI001F2B1C73